MPETYPDDTTLMDLSQDDATGVECIPTGQSPYAMTYRRMLYRLLRATERANDLRVYAIGGRSVGVRAGRCFVGGTPRIITGSTSIELGADTVSHLYIDESGVIQVSTTGLPADRATFIPLAEATTDAETLIQLTDLRGEAMLQAQTAALAGITATAQEINDALGGIGPDVTAANLSILTGGATSTADSQHRHLSTTQQVDGLAAVSLVNLSSDSAANVALAFSLPSAMPDATTLQVDRNNGYLKQAYLGQSYHMLGASSLGWSHSGPLSAGVTGQLVGTVPVGGEVVAVILSCGLNTGSTNPADGLSLHAFVNGSALTTGPATLTAADGVGFLSTDQGAGTPSTLATTGAQNVNRGDQVTIDLTYSAAGTISQAPTNVGVLFVVKAARPL